MRRVPIARFKDKMSEIMAAAEAEKDIVITRRGRDYMKLVTAEDDRLARQRAVVNAMYKRARRIKAKHGPTTPEEIRAWIDEGRR